MVIILSFIYSREKHNERVMFKCTIECGKLIPTCPRVYTDHVRCHTALIKRTNLAQNCVSCGKIAK